MFGERRTYRCYNDYYCVFILQLFKNQFNVNIKKKKKTKLWFIYVWMLNENPDVVVNCYALIGQRCGNYVSVKAIRPSLCPRAPTCVFR